MNIIEEIKNRISIDFLLNKFGLQINNSGFVKSISHEEKTASLKIYKQSNTWYDYSRNEGGDVIDFYAEYNRIDKSTAIKELQNMAGLGGDNIKQRTFAPALNPYAYKEESIIDCMSAMENELYCERIGMGMTEEKALREVRLMRIESNTKIFTELYYYVLKKGWDPAAYKYLTEERKISAMMIEKQKLFSLKNYFEVNNHMKKQFDIDDLRRSGLYNEKGNLIFFAHRIIIPYQYNYKIVYLRGRYFDIENNSKTDGNKYLGLRNDALNVNTPKRFWGIDVLKNMLKGENLYLTEGEFDAIVLRANGFNSICIPGSGNFPAKKQFEKLKNYKCIVCPDSDEAGRKMIDGYFIDSKGLQRYSPINLRKIFRDQKQELYVKKMPGKDVNEFFAKGAA
jgi:DNA primase